MAHTIVRTRQDLGRFVRQVRQRRGISQVELARRLGVRQPAVSQMERGVVSVEAVVKAVEAMGCHLALDTVAHRDRLRRVIFPSLRDRQQNRPGG